MNNFSANFLALKTFKNKLRVQKVAHLTFVQKSCSKNVGEIDPR
jgi:hypothetical protein